METPWFNSRQHHLTRIRQQGFSLQQTENGSSLQELLKLRAMRSGAGGGASGPSPAEAAGDEDVEWSQVGRKGTVATTRGDESLQARP